MWQKVGGGLEPSSLTEVYAYVSMSTVALYTDSGVLLKINLGVQRAVSTLLSQQPRNTLARPDVESTTNRQQIEPVHYDDDRT